MGNKTLTTKQYDILKYLYKFRFLTSIHLQKLQNDNTTRLTNYHLKILDSQKYIAKHYTRKLGEGNKPAVYYLAVGSIKALQVNLEMQKDKLKYIYRERSRSKQFISNSLFIADYYMHLLNESAQTNQTLHFFTKTDLLMYQYIIHPLPDAYFARIDTQGEIKRYFVEVINENTPRFILRKRIDQYNTYIESKIFEEVTGHAFPTLLIICPNSGMKKYVAKHLAGVYEESSMDQVDIYLATQEDVYAKEWKKAGSEEE